MLQLSKPRVVIVGAGFGGLTAAQNLSNPKLDVILIDKTNHHLFQPLLYQVATAALSPGEIAAPIRATLRKHKNVQVIMGEVESIDLNKRIIKLNEGELYFDYLILSPGSRHSYFGKPEWEQFAPGLKSLDDALNIRERILISFEKAERVYHSKEAKKHLTFIIVGGGPTGVELAGAIAEISRKTILPDFPLLRKEDIKIVIIEAHEKLLTSFPSILSDYTLKVLNKLGVNIIFNKRVISLNKDGVDIGNEFIESSNIIWAAGNEASPILKTLNTELDFSGRVLVENDLSVKGFQDVFVIGDAANLKDKNADILPGVAPVAMQEAKYVANIINKKIEKENRKPFNYIDKGNLATIGIAKAVAYRNKVKLTGFSAWFMWTFIHIFFLISLVFGWRRRIPPEL